MKDYTQELEALQAQMRQKTKAQSALKSLKDQLASLQKQETSLRQIRVKEAKDVERASGGTLSAFVYYILGSRQQHIDKEEAEAYAAAVKHDSVCAQIAGVEGDIAYYEKILSEVADCESRYKALLAEKSAALKSTQPQKAAQICALEEQICYLKGQLKETSEAYWAGKQVVEQLAGLDQSLSSAQNWGVVDLFGGGLISGAAKYSHLDEAQSQMHLLQSLLRRYATELADIEIEHPVDIKPGSFLTFADFFFDNLWADFAVLDHIAKSQERVCAIKSKVSAVQSRLLTTKNTLSAQLEQRTGELEALVAGASL